MEHEPVRVGFICRECAQKFCKFPKNLPPAGAILLGGCEWCESDEVKLITHVRHFGGVNENSD